MLEGELVRRLPDGEHRLSRGDLVTFPAGGDGARTVTNRGSKAAQIVMFSSGAHPRRCGVSGQRQDRRLAGHSGTPHEHQQTAKLRHDPPTRRVRERRPLQRPLLLRRGSTSPSALPKLGCPRRC
jgi:uncharacterized cupin superfamily protein